MSKKSIDVSEKLADIIENLRNEKNYNDESAYLNQAFVDCVLLDGGGVPNDISAIKCILSSYWGVLKNIQDEELTKRNNFKKVLSIPSGLEAIFEPAFVTLFYGDITPQEFEHLSDLSMGKTWLFSPEPLKTEMFERLEELADNVLELKKNSGMTKYIIRKCKFHDNVGKEFVL